MLPPASLKKLRSRLSAGFTLVEVTLAIGVVAFALSGIIGLLPVGLQSHSRATEITVSTQIVQQVTANLLDAPTSSLVDPSGALRQFPITYFDAQGMLLGDETNPPSRMENVLYHAAAATELDSDTATLAHLRVDVVKNPGNIPLLRDPETGGISPQAAKGLVPLHFSSYVARNL
jgi:uncharacterized protein (TIGR02598 family)